MVSKEIPFYLVAHSYGCLVAVEVASALEKEGLVGTLVLIDGSPKGLVNLAKERIGSYTGVEFEMKVLEEVVPYLVPEEAVVIAMVNISYLRRLILHCEQILLWVRNGFFHTIKSYTRIYIRHLNL